MLYGRDFRAVAERLLKGHRFTPSQNDYDWLGQGIYFWEYGFDRAMQFARDQKKRGKVKKPAVVGALLQLGRCFDLMDTWFTRKLARGYEPWAAAMKAQKTKLPTNDGVTRDKLLRRLDCAVINWYLAGAAEAGLQYESVRCGFVEGTPVYEGTQIHQQSHVQIAVRNPRCVIGVFRPMMEEP